MASNRSMRSATDSKSSSNLVERVRVREVERAGCDAGVLDEDAVVPLPVAVEGAGGAEGAPGTPSTTAPPPCSDSDPPGFASMPSMVGADALFVAARYRSLKAPKQ